MLLVDVFSKGCLCFVFKSRLFRVSQKGMGFRGQCCFKGGFKFELKVTLMPDKHTLEEVLLVNFETNVGVRTNFMKKQPNILANKSSLFEFA